VQTETWSRTYQYSVKNDSFIATTTLAKYIPPHIIVARKRVLVSDEGQPIMCYGCNGTCHLSHTCPINGKQRKRHLQDTLHPGWTLLQKGPEDQIKDREVAEGEVKRNIQTEHAEKKYEDVREAHSAEGKRILQERDLLIAPTLEEICSSESSATKASVELMPMHEELDRMECGMMELEGDTVDTRHTTLPTQQVQKRTSSRIRRRGRVGTKCQRWMCETWGALQHIQTRNKRMQRNQPRPSNRKK